MVDRELDRDPEIEVEDDSEISEYRKTLAEYALTLDHDELLLAKWENDLNQLPENELTKADRELLREQIGGVRKRIAEIRQKQAELEAAVNDLAYDKSLATMGPDLIRTDTDDDKLM